MWPPCGGETLIRRRSPAAATWTMDPADLWTEREMNMETQIRTNGPGVWALFARTPFTVSSRQTKHRPAEEKQTVIKRILILEMSFFFGTEKMGFKVNTGCDADPRQFQEEFGPLVVLCVTSASYGPIASPLCETKHCDTWFSGRPQWHYCWHAIFCWHLFFLRQDSKVVDGTQNSLLLWPRWSLTKVISKSQASHM